MIYDFICIGCPLGCNLHVEVNKEEINVTGNTCKRGLTYAKEEVTNPTRIVTSTIRLAAQDYVIPVKTSSPVPKEKIFACLDEIKAVKLDHVPEFHEVVIANVCNTGADVIVTKG